MTMTYIHIHNDLQYSEIHISISIYCTVHIRGSDSDPAFPSRHLADKCSSLLFKQWWYVPPTLANAISLDGTWVQDKSMVNLSAMLAWSRLAKCRLQMIAEQYKEPRQCTQYMSRSQKHCRLFEQVIQKRLIFCRIDTKHSRDAAFNCLLSGLS